MQHSTKMVLVPHDMMQQRNETPPIRVQMSNLDTEMRKILENSHLPTDAKLTEYNQILHHFRKLQEEQQQPHKIEIIEKQAKSEDNEEKQKTENSTHEEDKTILMGLPHKNRKNAELLLHYVRKNPHLKFNERGEMLVDGKRFVGSHLVDLIHYFSRDRPTKTTVEGAEAFANALRKENVPKESIANKHGRELLTEKSPMIYATPNQNDIIASVSSKVSAKRRTRQQTRKQLQWDEEFN